MSDTHKVDDDDEPGNISAILTAPLRLSNAIISKGTEYIKPKAPQLITFSVCLLLVPVLVFLSVFAGWFVWKNVAVGWDAPVYLQYGDGVPPYAELPLPSLVAQQPYEISLHITIPTSESNFALGNFMTALRLSTTSNRTLTSICRPSIAIPTRSSFWSSQPSVVGITIPLLSSFVPGTSRVIAKVELGRRDGWKNLGEGYGRELSVISASLRGVIKLRGLRGLVTRFPIFSSLISSIMFLVLSLLVLIAFFLPALRWTSTPYPETRPQPQMPTTPRQRGKRRSGLSDDSEDYDDDEEKPWSRRRSRPNTGNSHREGSSSHSRPLPRASDPDVKTETTSTFIPEASADSSTPLRRRRSRLSQPQSDEDS